MGQSNSESQDVVWRVVVSPNRAEMQTLCSDISPPLQTHQLLAFSWLTGTGSAKGLRAALLLFIHIKTTCILGPAKLKL